MCTFLYVLANSSLKQIELILVLGTKTVEHILTWLDLAMNVPLKINVPKELDDLRETTSVIVGCFPGVRAKFHYIFWLKCQKLKQEISGQIDLVSKTMN